MGEIITIDKYTALHLDEYKGVFSIIEGYVGKEGDFKNRWIKEEMGKEKVEKNMPKRVKLGNKQAAVEVARWILAYLDPGQDQRQDIPGDDMPF
jgi:hypothetical protein